MLVKNLFKTCTNSIYTATRFQNNLLKLACFFGATKHNYAHADAFLWWSVKVPHQTRHSECSLVCKVRQHLHTFKAIVLRFALRVVIINTPALVNQKIKILGLIDPQHICIYHCHQKHQYQPKQIHPFYGTRRSTSKFLKLKSLKDGQPSRSGAPIPNPKVELSVKQNQTQLNTMPRFAKSASNCARNSCDTPSRDDQNLGIN
mmetsp:Transcript_24120/g.39034  ORF Transcript_24120/g.39034 Transcript_24120/m.39034 type:complete len:203 (-) Transcript_24120:317-925(-)